MGGAQASSAGPPANPLVRGSKDGRRSAAAAALDLLNHPRVIKTVYDPHKRVHTRRHAHPYIPTFVFQRRPHSQQDAFDDTREIPPGPFCQHQPPVMRRRPLIAANRGLTHQPQRKDRTVQSGLLVGESLTKPAWIYGIDQS